MALYLVGDEDINQEGAGFFFLDPHLVNAAIPSQHLMSDHFDENKDLTPILN